MPHSYQELIVYEFSKARRFCILYPPPKLIYAQLYQDLEKDYDSDTLRWTKPIDTLLTLAEDMGT